MKPMNKKRFALIITLFLSFSLCGCSNIKKDSDSVTDYVPSVNEVTDSVSLPAVTAETYSVNTKTKPSHLKLSVTDSGNEIFSPNSSLSHDYRYGPSMVLNDDKSIDAWFSSPGDGSAEFDWVTHRHSDDNGETWSDEKVVLSPTPNSLDALSVCDPDVFFHDGFYYMGYTSTVDETNNGLCNSIFLARSENPDGPFEKWNGSGWGGMPKPIIYYDGVSIGWGIGEPSFVIVDDTLYIYTTKDSYSDEYYRIKSTEVYSAVITEDDWQNNINYLGCCVIRTDTEEDAEYVYSDCDSWDVVYVEENEMFLAVCTNRRFSDDSCLLYYESSDGIDFTRVSELNNNVICGCHNCGIMGDRLGHIKQGDPMLVSYAYSGSNTSSWGIWATRLAPLSLELTDDMAENEDGISNLKLPIHYSRQHKNPWVVSVGAEKLTYRQVAGAENFNISFYSIDSNHSTHYIDEKDISFSGYDKAVVSLRDGKIRPVAAGITPITVSYEGVSRQLCLCVLSKDASQEYYLTKLISPVSEYRITLIRPYAVAIRPLAEFSNSFLGELNSDEISSYKLKFKVEDESVCTVRDDAVITALSPGSTVITVSAPSGISYEVKVRVTAS